MKQSGGLDMERCDWCKGDKKMLEYHDKQWGIPVHDDIKHFEYISLEVMQCGLNWKMMLDKRDIFNKCFDKFDYEKISKYSEKKIIKILDTEGMIKSRRKIEAIINNAKAFKKIIDEFGSFDNYIWKYTDFKTLIYHKHTLGEYVTHNKLSDEISKDLKKRGFKFLGSITVYSHLQACGMINDHEPKCERKIIQ